VQKVKYHLLRGAPQVSNVAAADIAGEGLGELIRAGWLLAHALNSATPTSARFKRRLCGLLIARNVDASLSRPVRA
jgi:hypothetical protein